MMPYIPKKNNNEINNTNNLKNQEGKTESKEDEKAKNVPTIFVPAPIFYNPIIKNPKNIYGKYHQKKKTRPFTERQGDWVCKLCKNLNFAFRNECNRCKVSKKVSLEQNEKNEINNKSKNTNKKIYKNKKGFSNINDKDFNRNQKHLEYDMNDKSFEE